MGRSTGVYLVVLGWSILIRYLFLHLRSLEGYKVHGWISLTGDIIFGNLELVLQSSVLGDKGVNLLHGR